MVTVMGEARGGTPSSYAPPAMQSPRYGGCVSAFFTLFDWTSAKRCSTKRLPASKSEKGSFRLSRSFRTDHGKTRTRCDVQIMRPPGVVARLMGLDSLPEASYAPARHRESRGFSGSRSPPRNFHSDVGTPVLLQDLLQQDFKAPAKTKSLRERLPALFNNNKRAHRQYETRFTKRGGSSSSRRASALTAFRCRSEEWCISPAFVDIPQVQSRFMYAVGQKPKDTKQQQLPFLSRLPPSSTIHGEEIIPELSLRASSMGREILLQGWPLAGQHNVPRDLYHENDTPSSSGMQASESVGSKPTDSASSKPLLMNANSKVVHGRRRGSSWNGSDDSESTIDGPRRRASKSKAPEHRSLQSQSPPSHRNRRSKAIAVTSNATPSRRPRCSRSPVPKAPSDHRPLIIPVEHSRTSVSHRSVSTCTSQSSATGELRSVSSKAPPIAGRGKGAGAGRSGAKSANSFMKNASGTDRISPVRKTTPTPPPLPTTTTKTKMTSKDNDERRSGKTVRSPALAPGKPPPEGSVKTVRHPKGKPVSSSPFDAPSDAASGDRIHLSTTKSSALLNHGPRFLNGRKEGDARDSSAKSQRCTEKAAAGGVGSRQKGIQKARHAGTSLSETKPPVHALGDRLQNGNNTNATDMASQRSIITSAHTAEAVRSYESSIKQSQSVDASLNPEVPPAPESKVNLQFSDSRLHRPVERELFAEGSSPDIGCRNGASAAGDQISTSPLMDYDELCDSGEYGRMLEGISSSPLIDCDELRSLGGTAAESNIESISVESYPVQEFSAPDEIRWEDEIVETLLSGRCCERSCSGPSVSSRSITFSDEERNGDSWSSCASYNPGDRDSPSDSPRTNCEIEENDVEPGDLPPEPTSPPMQLVKKILEERDAMVMEQLADEAGQPSPVSILQSPFHDEACTTSESSPESMRQFIPQEPDLADDEEQPPPPPTSNIDRIKQALLDISTFRIDDASCTFDDTTPREHHHHHHHHPKDEQSFIREVLSAANFLSTPGSSPDWYDRDVAIDPALFDRLESEGVSLTSGGLWRCDRKLLFDCVNEAFGLSSLWQFRGGHELVGLLLPEVAWGASRPRGAELVVIVRKEIEHWRELAEWAIDSLIERDMSVRFGSWKFFGPEVAEVGAEIESLVWKGILDEVVVDIASLTQKKRRH